LKGGVPEIYAYDEIPQTLRVQIIHIMQDTLGTPVDYINFRPVRDAIDFIVSTLRREYGVFELLPKTGHRSRDTPTELYDFMLGETNHERVLDAIEISFKIIDKFTRKITYKRHNEASEQAEDAINELNVRFREHAIGYQFEAGLIVRVDSQLLHSEVVRPALVILHDEAYAGAEDEYHAAYEHYRHGHMKDALISALKALESTIKVIAKKRNWAIPENATATPLVGLMFENKLIPEFWAKHFSGLRSMLDSGVPTVRNKMGGHGQGAEVTEVPSHMVAYALHQTAAAIVYLAKAEVELA
jgi:hypothetical protein